MKKGVMQVSCLWILTIFLTWLFASYGFARGKPSAAIPSPTVISHKNASPTPTF
jgi:hypothetical protein